MAELRSNSSQPTLFTKARTQMPGPITKAWYYQMLRTNEGYMDTRPASISTRREVSEPTSRNRGNQETFCGVSMGRPTGLRHDEIPKLSRSRLTDVLGVLAAQNSSPEAPVRPVQDTKLGGPPTRVVCRGAPHLPHRRLPVSLGDLSESYPYRADLACSAPTKSHGDG